MNLTSADKAKLQAFRDYLYLLGEDLMVYPGELETRTSSDATHVTVTYDVRKVMSVWLATDTGFTGTNYYSNPKLENFSGKAITLSSSLPAANTSVKVAYYKDCATCGWDAYQRTGRDSNCAVCNGTGMILADGTGVAIPIKKLKPGYRKEPLGSTGEEVLGKITFHTKYEYESLIRAAKKITIGNAELTIWESPEGAMGIQPLSDFAGEPSLIAVVAEYKRYAG